MTPRVLGTCERCGRPVLEGEKLLHRRGRPALHAHHFHSGEGRTHFRSDVKRGASLLALDLYLNEHGIPQRGKPKKGGRPPLRKGGWAGEKAEESKR